MALHNLVITVVDGKTYNSVKSGSGAKSASGGCGKEKTKLDKTLHFNDTIKSKIQENVTPTTFFGLSMAANVAKQAIRQTANYYISDIGRSNGDNNFQDYVNRKIEIVSDVGSFVGGAFSGAAAGASLGAGAGPIGIAIGAILGAASSAISTGFKYAGRERELQHELFKENTSQAYNLARANYSAWTGRLR